MDEHDNYDDTEPRPICPFLCHSAEFSPFEECVMELMPELYEGHICPRSGIPALGEDE